MKDCCSTNLPIVLTERPACRLLVPSHAWTGAVGGHVPALCSRLGGKGSGFPLRPAEDAQEAFGGLQPDLQQPVTLRATAAISSLACSSGV